MIEETNNSGESEIDALNRTPVDEAIRKRLISADDAWDVVSKSFSSKAVSAFDEAIANFGSELYRHAESQRKIDKSDYVDQKHVNEANRTLRASRSPAVWDSIILPGIGFMLVGLALNGVATWVKNPSNITVNEIGFNISALVAGFIFIAIVIARVFKR